MQETTKPWVDISSPTPNKLILENVYLNGLHALCRIQIRNLTPQPLLIKFRSNLGSQIAFQLSNENLPPQTLVRRKKTSLGAATPSALSLDSSLESLHTNSIAESDSSSGSLVSPHESHSPSTTTDDFSGNPIAQITTNTVAAAMLNAGRESKLHGHHFNQLFNYVNHIDSVHLGPFQVQSVILAFLPDERLRGRKRLLSEGIQEVDLREAFTPNDEDQTHDYFEINGLIFFFVYRDDLKQDLLENLSLGPELGHDPSSSAGTRTSVSQDMARERSFGARNPGDPFTFSQSRSTENGMAPLAQQKSVREKEEASPDYQVTLKFRSRVCKTVLWTDIGGAGLTFEDCVVGGTYFKDFTIWNRSEIELYFVLNTVDLSNRSDQTQIKFCDYDSGEPLDRRHIPAYSPLRIRIIFKPLDVGEFNYDLQIENSNDSTNTVRAHIHAMVRSVLKEESLVVSSGTTLDFGDCCAGTKSKQKLVLKNVSDLPLDITFSSDEPSLIFQLKTDDQEAEMALRGYTSEQLLLDRLHEASTLDSLTTDMSSVLSSRASSPVSLFRKDSEALSSVGSLANLEFLRQTSSNTSLMRLDPEDVTDISNPKADDGNEFTRIEEIQLRPGTERTIEVLYRPEKDPSSFDYLSGRLVSKSFRITLKYAPSGVHAKEKKVIQCKARSCTSVIDVSPKELQFGDTDVGTLKSLPLKITNLSDLIARVELRFVSKVLNCYRGELTIPAKQSIEVKIDNYPRKVNPDYRKQITVVNLLNRDNDQVVQVSSTNIDQHHVTYHSLFYRLMTSSSTNFIDFGSVILNAPVVRSFTIENVSKSKIVLALSSSASTEIIMYQKRLSINGGNFQNLPSMVDKREKLLQSIGDRRKVVRADNTPTMVPKTNLKTTQLHSLVNLLRTRSFAADSSSQETGSGSEYLDLAATNSKEGTRSKRRGSTTSGVPSLRLNSQTGETNEPRLSVVLGSSMDGRHSPSRITTVDSPTQSIVPDDIQSQSSRTSEFKINSKSKSGTDKSVTPGNLVEMLEMSKVPIETILALLETDGGSMFSSFPKASTEEKFVRTKVLLFRELRKAIEETHLIPVSTIEVPPDGQRTVYVIYTPSATDKPYVQGKPKKQDARIFIELKDLGFQLKELNKTLDRSQGASEIPIRELMVRSSVCRSIMELGQKNINFGLLEKHERRTKTIMIRNNSESPLLYAIRKSGSIASGDLIISEGKMGIIRAFAKKEVGFLFDPSLSGPFNERLTIDNVYDPSNSQVITIKANVKKSTNFFIEKLSIDFGVCLINEAAPTTQQIVISNTSMKQFRVMEVRFNDLELISGDIKGEVSFDMLEEDAFDEAPDQITETKVRRRRRPMMMMSKDMEEQIEHLEQKLKIARRKGRKDKVKKIVDKIERLRCGLIGEDYENDGSDNEKSTISMSRVQSTTQQGEPVLDQVMFTKTKKTDHSIVFSIAPRSIRTVVVSFCPKGASEPQDLSDNTEVRTFSGIIYVQEHKNTDVVKKVSFQSRVCYNHFTYLQALSELNDSKKPEELEEGTPSVTFKRVPSVARSTSEMPSSISPVPLATAPVSEVVSSPMLLELAIIDLGKLEVNEKRDCYFTLRNSSGSDVNFEIVSPLHSSALIFPRVTGTLPGNETKRINLSLIPQQKGRQSYSFQVRSLPDNTERSVTFVCYGVLGAYLQFRSLEDDIIGDIDFGFCCVDTSKKFTRVFPLKIRNISEDPILVNVSSNLAQQCAIFWENTLENALTELSLIASETRIVFVALQPYLSQSSNSNKKLSGFTPDKSISTNLQQPNTLSEPRALVGGLKFHVQIRELQPSDGSHLVNVATQTLRFQAVTGQSILEVSNHLVNLGSTHELGAEYECIFHVHNKTPRLPLHLKLRISSEWITADEKELRIEPRPGDATDAGEDYQVVRLKVKAIRFGLLNEDIQVVNLNNSQQKEVVTIRLFVDPDVLRCTQISEVSSSISGQNRLIWNNVYILSNRNLSGKGRFCISSRDSASQGHFFELENHSDELMQVYPKSNLKTHLRWMISNETGFVMENPMPEESDLSEVEDAPRIGKTLLNMRGGFKVCGPCLMIHPRKKVSAYVDIPEPLFSISYGDDSALTTKQMVLDGILVLETAQGETLQIVDITASYCESVGVVDVNTIELGKIGHITSWEPVSFQFIIRNVSDIPLFYAIGLPACISIVAPDSHELQHNEGEIPPLSMRVFHGTLNSRLVEDMRVGQKTFGIEIKNLFNPSNLMSISVNTFLTLSEIRFERLVNNELYLPAIPYPALSTTVSADVWFNVVNLSDEEKKLELVPVLLPKVEEMVDISVIARMSNSALIGPVSLLARGNIEVKVRVSPREGFALSENDSRREWFDYPDGVVFGAIRIFSSDLLVKDVTDPHKDYQLVDNIPVRGCFREEASFALSRRHIQFQTYSAWEDENDMDPTRAGYLQTEALSLTNLCNSRMLEISVSIEFPIELGFQSATLNVHPLDNNMKAMVPPGGNLLLNIDLLDSRIDGLSEDIQIRIIDCNSLSHEPQVIFVGIESVQPPNVKLLPDDIQNASVSMRASSSGRQTEFAFEHSLMERSDVSGGGFLKIEEPWMSESGQSESQASGVQSSLAVSGGLSTHSSLEFISGHSQRRQHIIALRGCKRISDNQSNGVIESGGLFILDLAQQDLGPVVVARKLILENVFGEKILYRFKVLGGDVAWMMLSRTEGAFEGSKLPTQNDKETHAITLSFATTIRGSYTAYILLETVSNPADSKIIKVLMEVVASQNVRRAVTDVNILQTSRIPESQVSNRVFDVYVSGISAETDIIELDQLFFDIPDSGKCIVIHNRETVPFEFVIKSNFPNSDGAELMFSLSRTTAKLFRNLIIDAESSMRVYIRFIPPRSWLQPMRLPEEMTLVEASEPIQKTAEIMVNCRLVKDYSKVIFLKASCRQPQINISQSDFTFPGTISKNEVPGVDMDRQWNVDFTTDSDILTITNILRDPLEYAIMSDSMYFAYENEDAMQLPDGKPWERYVLEHITIYNRQRPIEKHWISLKLCLGHLVQFQYASGSRSSFDRLELSISVFLNEVQSHLSIFQYGQDNGSAKDQSEDRLEDLFFKYTYIVDQLIHYGTREHGENYLQLATLLFRHALLDD